MTWTSRLRRGRYLGCLGLVIGVCSSASVARAYVVEGDAALERGEVDRALDRFERAERLVPAPDVSDFAKLASVSPSTANICNVAAGEEPSPQGADMALLGRNQSGFVLRGSF